MDSALYWGTLYIYRLNNNNAFIERETAGGGEA